MGVLRFVSRPVCQLRVNGVSENKGYRIFWGLYNEDPTMRGTQQGALFSETPKSQIRKALCKLCSVHYTRHLMHKLFSLHKDGNGDPNINQRPLQKEGL